jgi:hypothetical protein
MIRKLASRGISSIVDTLAECKGIKVRHETLLHHAIQLSDKTRTYTPTQTLTPTPSKSPSHPPSPS